LLGDRRSGSSLGIVARELGQPCGAVERRWGAIVTSRSDGDAHADEIRASRPRASAAATPPVSRVAAPAGPAAPERWIQDFIDHEYQQVVATVQLVCGSRVEAEEAVQEALARAWEQRARDRVLDRPAAWVTTVALNVARSRLRHLKVERDARRRLAVDPRVDDAATASADAQIVRDALRTLPRRQREVTVLRYYGGLTVAEIASWLDTSEGNVKAMLFRARASLAKALGSAIDD
jgi:RNA polymerase sigma-70 factor (ECF subfamily)